MTKTAFAALILVILSVAISVAWIFVPPSTNLLNFVTQIDVGAEIDVGTGHEQAQIGVAHSSEPSLRGKREAIAESTVNASISPARNTIEPSTPAVATSGSVDPTRIGRPASTFSDDGHMDELAISGQVKDEEGNPLANIEVLAEPIGIPNAVSQSALTDSSGVFYLGSLDDREYRIGAAHMFGFAPAVVTARAGEIFVNLVLVSIQEVWVSGVVNSTEGKPLEDVRVSVGPPTLSTNTGPEGKYELDIIIKGKRRPPNINFRHPGYRDKSVPLDLADLDDMLDNVQLDVSMEPLKGLTTVTGHLKDPDGNPVAEKVIHMRSAKLKNNFRARSDVKGYFSMEGVEPGNDYFLFVRPGADYRDYDRTQLKIPAGGLTLDVVLEPIAHGALSGWMTDVNGNPIPGFALTLQSKLSTGHSVQVVGDHQGFFVVEEFPEGDVVLKTKSYPIFETRGIRVSPVPEEAVSVVLDMGPHTLFGQTTAGGDTVGAANLTLNWEHDESGSKNISARQTTADRNGEFAFAGLGSGVHFLRVKAPGFRMAIIKINVGMDPNNIVVELEKES